MGAFVTAAASAYPIVGPLTVGGGRLLLGMFCNSAGDDKKEHDNIKALKAVQKSMTQLESMLTVVLDEVLEDVKPAGAEISLGAGHGARGATTKLVGLV